MPLAYGVVATAPFIGSGLASLLGGPLVDYLEARPALALPVLGEIFSWQAVLVLVGLPGILLALLVFTVREPERRLISVCRFRVSRSSPGSSSS